MNSFKNVYDYRLIYVFEVKDEKHKDVVKIGDTSFGSDKKYSEFTPNSNDLYVFAEKRVKHICDTLGADYNILHWQVAADKNGKAFRDYEVHKVLQRSGTEKAEIGNSKEWFKCNKETAVKAINAVIEGEKTIDNIEYTEDMSPIVFRPEQAEAIEKTIEKFKTGKRYLWNAKMRFGKTLCALEVVRRKKFGRTLIITHRPAVKDGWYEDFNKIFRNNKTEYMYGSKSLDISIKDCEDKGRNYVYFASIQDLRGSAEVGGNFDKNNEIFNTQWDLLIIDEAHEGTTTELGERVKEELAKDNSGMKILELSGTPFNLMEKYDAEEIFTWDYIMEQEAKENWEKEHDGDSNPYAELPKLNIFTYDLGKLLNDTSFVDYSDKCFNFAEFFRLKEDSKGNKTEEFVHKDSIKKFLKIICNGKNYPYSEKEYRDMFRHTLWRVPGVMSARALSRLLKDDEVFGDGSFKIINVAGDGDAEEESADALSKVQDGIKEAEKNNQYTITLSCGKLTTGITIPEWTACLMLSGSANTNAANYLQTIFRVTSTYKKDGKFKTNAYVFDFAPDRTLQMLVESVKIKTKPTDKPYRDENEDRAKLGRLLNFLPVIAFDGSAMTAYSVDKMFTELKKVYIEKVVNSGFESADLYTNDLFRLTDVDVKDFNDLQAKIGKTQQSVKTAKININRQGLTEEEWEKLKEERKRKKAELTPQQLKELEELRKKAEEAKKQHKNCVAILRGISIRLPLLVYGMKGTPETDIKISDLRDLVDDVSWEEFMPKGVTKEIFAKFEKYYDPEIFRGAVLRIRTLASAADQMEIEERVRSIGNLFLKFRNPDKETVLTPWRVVNMHLSDTLGGYDFFDQNHSEVYGGKARFCDRWEVTKKAFATDSKVLEINSKTGLYPLYVAYSIYASKKKSYAKSKPEMTDEEIWEETIKNNIFAICKTPMAVAITKRTLSGYNNYRVNAKYYVNIIDTMKNTPEKFTKDISDGQFWDLGGKEMKFNAIVGNPPYQLTTGTNTQQAVPLYHYFVINSIKLNPNYVSIIMPARWYSGGFSSLHNFRNEFLNDKRIEILYDYPNPKEVFNGVDIAGGVCYFLWNKNKNFSKCKVINVSNNVKIESNRELNEYKTFIRDNRALNIIKKIFEIENTTNTLEDIVSPQKPFALSTNYKPYDKGIPCYFIQKIGKKYANKLDVKDENNLLNKWKLLLPKAPIAGQTDFTKPIGFYYNGNTYIAEPGSCCTESFIVGGAFDNKEEVINYKSYLFTKIVRFLLLQTVISQDVLRNKFCYIPALKKYDKQYTDEILRKKWNITNEEWNYIDSKIHNYENKR